MREKQGCPFPPVLGLECVSDPIWTQRIGSGSLPVARHPPPPHGGRNIICLVEARNLGRELIV